jgi:hypothetical protein
VRVYNQFQPTAPGAALAHALEGYTYIFLAENWCSGVPVSTVTESGETQYSPPRSTDDLLSLAIVQFDSASSIAAAAGSDAADYGNLALVGKARALVDQNKLTDAAQVASTVPDDFEFLIQHSENTTTEYNGVWYMNQNTGRYSVVNKEGGNGLPYLQSPADPRVPWDTAARKPFDTTISLPLLEQLKYPDRGSPTVLANGVEARLIEAEAKLNGGGSAAYLPILNELRATVELPALGDPGSDAARVDQFFQERAFWLWLTSHRLGDMRRLIKYYGRTEDQVYPTGDYYRAGAVYGDDVSLPVPVTEENNPEYKKAESMCDPTKA